MSDIQLGGRYNEESYDRSHQGNERKIGTYTGWMFSVSSKVEKKNEDMWSYLKKDILDQRRYLLIMV